MLGVWALISAIGTTGKIIKEKCEPTLPPEYHGNMKAEVEDARKVMLGEMSRYEFNRNINNGKYYAAPKKNDYDLWIRRIEKYKEIHPEYNNYTVDWHLDYVKECKQYNKQLDILNGFWRYESMDEYL